MASDSWMRPRAIRLALGQLRARSEPALIAAVGLDTGGRERASRLLRERLRDEGRPLWSQAEVGFVALELEDKAGPASEECAGIIVQALTVDHAENLRTSWRNHLIEGSARLDPSVSAPYSLPHCNGKRMWLSALGWPRPWRVWRVN